MKELLISQIAPIIATGIVAILVKLVYPIGGAAIKLFLKLKEEAEQRIKASGHEQDIKIGWETWKELDEKWRITDKVEDLLTSKGDEFLSIMKQKIPYLTEDEIITIRQAIAGEVNKGKAAVLSQADALKQLQDANTQLQAENANIKDQLSKVQSVVAVNATTQETAAATIDTTTPTSATIQA